MQPDEHICWYLQPGYMLQRAWILHVYCILTHVLPQDRVLAPQKMHGIRFGAKDLHSLTSVANNLYSITHNGIWPMRVRYWHKQTYVFRDLKWWYTTDDMLKFIHSFDIFSIQHTSRDDKHFAGNLKVRPNSKMGGGEYYLVCDRPQYHMRGDTEISDIVFDTEIAIQIMGTSYLVIQSILCYPFITQLYYIYRSLSYGELHQQFGPIATTAYKSSANTLSTSCNNQ